MVMRRLSQSEARERLLWLETAPPMKGGFGGYATEGWADSVWVLHAMFERDDMPADLTYDQVHQANLASGSEKPHVVNGVDLSEGATLTGITFGDATTPGPPWKRLRWAEWAAREGFELGVGMRFPPCDLWFSVPSWPVRILPPVEGSFDESTLNALVHILIRHTPAEALRDCSAFLSPLAAHYVTGDYDEMTVYAGDIDDVPELTVERNRSPSNLWPADRSWLVYTDWDLMATRVSGSRELIAAIETDQELETIRWQRSTATTT